MNNSENYKMSDNGAGCGFYPHPILPPARGTPVEGREGVDSVGCMGNLQMMLSIIKPDHPAFELADRTGKLLTGLHKKWSAK
jgi:hypothetical protein